MNQEIIISIFTIITILVIYYAVYSTKKNAEKELKKMQSELKVGDKIVTYSGFAGIIKEVLEDRFIVEMYPGNVTMSVEKWAVAGIDDRTISTKEENNKEKKDKTESKKDK